mgnify:CR=1 FL=1
MVGVYVMYVMCYIAMCVDGVGIATPLDDIRLVLQVSKLSPHIRCCALCVCDVCDVLYSNVC